MQLRESLINLAITIALVCVVAVLALLLKGQRPPVAVAVPVAIPVTEQLSVPIPQPVTTRQKLDVMEVYPVPKLVDHPDNEPDSFRMRLGKEEAVFCLYFVDAFALSKDKPESLQVQTNRYVKVDPTMVAELKREAYRYAMDLITKKPTKLYTRWERHSDGKRYFALLEIEIEKGKKAYLGDLLLRQGYAKVGGVTCEVPGQTQVSYLTQMKKNTAYAQGKKLGLWSRIQG
jgi:hypothetical protein